MNILKKKMMINDPIHKVMNFYGSERDQKIIKSIIDSREFQRLRRISQLGLTSYVFPGATHSRFNHSLGTAYLAHEVLEHLKAISNKKVEREIEEYRLSIVISALLHDIGHGPFSHSFENVLKKLDEKKNNLSVLHEQWTYGIITSQKSGINKILKKNKIDPAFIAEPFSSDKSKNGKMPLYLRQIISSQLDVDRMDYLLRDSHFSGVTLGNFDALYLINCLSVIEHKKEGSRTLGINSKGVRTYESFLLARQLMNRSIFFHPKVKITEYMVEKMIRLLIKTPVNNLPFKPGYFEIVRKIIKATKSVKAEDFVRENLDDYLALTDDTIYTLANLIFRMDKVSIELKDIAKKIITRDLFKYRKIVEGKAHILEKELSREFEKNKDYDIIKLSTSMYKEKDTERVFVQNLDNKVDDISNHSNIITALKNRDESDYLLVIINNSKYKKIIKIAEEINNCVVTPKNNV